MEGDEREIRVWSAGCSFRRRAVLARHPHAQALGRERRRASRFRLHRRHGHRHRLSGRSRSAASIPTQRSATRRPICGSGISRRSPGCARCCPRYAGWSRSRLRDLLHFQPPVEEAHLIVCRNVIIYLERAAQDALFAHFHRTLAPGGLPRARQGRDASGRSERTLFAGECARAHFPQDIARRRRR